MASQPVVSNTSPLITLAGVGMLALLPSVYGEIRIAKAVCDEYETKRGTLEPALDTLVWLVVEAIEPDRELVAIQGLGRGEAATIALSTVLQARAVVLDDRLGRRIAIARGLPVIGTMTVLLRAKQQRLIPAVDPLIAAMLAQGRRISPRLRAHVLRIAGGRSRVTTVRKTLTGLTKRISHDGVGQKAELAEWEALLVPAEQIRPIRAKARPHARTLAVT